ncbi:MAG: hypothetical protein SW019_04640 [Actinomycetota bacterium]|nr:hypothetical protein [Actinomycetota bacterium]
MRYEPHDHGTRTAELAERACRAFDIRLTGARFLPGCADALR